MVYGSRIELFIVLLSEPFRSGRLVVDTRNRFSKLETYGVKGVNIFLLRVIGDVTKVEFNSNILIIEGQVISFTDP